MTRFHTDEYIDFLSKVTPENVEELMAQRSRCTSLAATLTTRSR